MEREIELKVKTKLVIALIENNNWKLNKYPHVNIYEFIFLLEYKINKLIYINKGIFQSIAILIPNIVIVST